MSLRQGVRTEGRLAPAPSGGADPRPARRDVIRFEDVSLTFDTRDRQKIVALQALRLAVGEGEIFSLVGPSGCGKSTALRLVAGLLKPSVGDVTVDGAHLKRHFDNVAIIFQKPTLLPWMSVLDNVLYPVRALRRVARADRERALALLATVGLADMAGRAPDELSGGMQQRAAICRGLILDPRVLLMDEPFGALDALTREELQLELLRLHRKTGKTILLVTHSIGEAVLLSDRVGVMSARPGRLSALVEIDLPYARSEATLGLPRFAELSQQIRGLIHGRPHL